MLAFAIVGGLLILGGIGLIAGRAGLSKANSRGNRKLAGSNWQEGRHASNEYGKHFLIAGIVLALSGVVVIVVGLAVA